MRKNVFLLVSLLIVASMVLTACGTPTAAEPVVITQIVNGETVVITATPEPAAANPAAASKDPTTWIEATFGDPETLDPAYDYETGGGGILMQVYDTLVWYNKDNAAEFVPQLATEVPSLENGGISADGKTVVFKIRSGVKFHDGTDHDPVRCGLHLPTWSAPGRYRFSPVALHRAGIGRRHL